MDQSDATQRSVLGLRFRLLSDDDGLLVVNRGAVGVGAIDHGLVHRMNGRQGSFVAIFLVFGGGRDRRRHLGSTDKSLEDSSALWGRKKKGEPLSVQTSSSVIHKERERKQGTENDFEEKRDKRRKDK